VPRADSPHRAGSARFPVHGRRHDSPTVLLTICSSRIPDVVKRPWPSRRGTGVSVCLLRDDPQEKVRHLKEELFPFFPLVSQG
jgi:hypothetical protein